MTNKLQVSYSEGRDGRIFVIGGETYDEFFTNLSDALGPELAERTVEDFAVIADPRSAPPSPSAQPQASAPVAAASAPGAPTCAHGARTFRSGTGKKGPWTAWFCPEPKGAVQCEAIWG